MHGSDSRSSHKQFLLSILQDVEVSASGLQRRAQSILEDAAHTRVVARNLADVIKTAPNDHAMPREVWEQLAGSWTTQRDQVKAVEGRLVAASTLTATTQSADLTTTLTSVVFMAWSPPAESLRQLHTVLSGPALFEGVASDLRRFGLDRDHESRRSALALLDEGRLALTRPSGSRAAPSAVLIPARESIHAAIASMLRRRPRQEPTRTSCDKIVSLGRQTGVADLPPGYFERLGAELESLLDRLSDSKQSAIPEDRVAREFDNVLHFHKTLLHSLDPARLRTP